MLDKSKNNSQYQDNVLITAIPIQPEAEQSQRSSKYQDDMDLEEEATNKIFNVREAVPPTDYDAPYSQLPTNVVLNRVKQNVKNSYQKMAAQKAKEAKDALNKKSLKTGGNFSLPKIGKQNTMMVANSIKKARQHWLNFLDEEHADAIISDAFWYVICKLMNPKEEFQQHQEFLLDRISANFVSFSLIEDSKYDKNQYAEAKKQFFKKFYDIISQAVYYSLYYAYPKSRKSLDEKFMRDLVNVFSELFTGTQIHSANLSHWEDVGASAFVSKAGTGRGAKDPSLADWDINKSTKSNRERLYMRYSPLVERYLITHNYETINNVKKWKMLLTQRTEIQKDVDKKFKKFQEISNAAIKTRNALNQEYKRQCKEAEQQHAENKKAAEEYFMNLKASKKEKKENGSFPEQANLITSIYQSKHNNNIGEE